MMIFEEIENINHKLMMSQPPDSILLTEKSDKLVETCHASLGLTTSLEQLDELGHYGQLGWVLQFLHLV